MATDFFVFIFSVEFKVYEYKTISLFLSLKVLKVILEAFHMFAEFVLNSTHNLYPAKIPLNKIEL